MLPKRFERRTVNGAQNPRSKLLGFEFCSVSRSQIEEFVEETGKEKAERIVKVSLGRPGLAKELMNPKIFEEHQEKLEQLDKIVKENFAQRFDYAEKLSKEEDLDYALNL